MTTPPCIVQQDDEKKAALITSLSGDASPEIAALIAAWKEDAIYLYKTAGDKVIPVHLGEDKDADGKQPGFLIEDESPLKDASGQPISVLAADLDTAAHDSNLRSVMKGVLDLQALVAQRREPLTVLQVEPAVLRPPGDPEATLVGDPLLYRPLTPLLWTIAVHGPRSELLTEITGAAVYRVSPAFDLAVLRAEGPFRKAVQQLRREVASQREIASWPGMNRERTTRLLNALYLQAGLIVSRSHPAALGDSWFGGARSAGPI